MRDLFDWADDRASAVVIRADKLFHRRREAVVTRLLFGPPMPRLDGVVLHFAPVRNEDRQEQNQPTARKEPDMHNKSSERHADLSRLTAAAEKEARAKFPENPDAREAFVRAYIEGALQERARWDVVLRHPLAAGREMPAAALLEFDLPAETVLAAMEAGTPNDDGAPN